MAEYCIKILDKNYNTNAVAADEGEVNLVYTRRYEEGDQIIIEYSGKGTFVWLMLDDALGRSLVYITGNTTYKVPFGNQAVNLSPKAFSGSRHLLSIREAQNFELEGERNLACNVCDQHEIANLYPHGIANVETRGEAVFAAQNAMDGVTVNHCHGEWPYESWGINRQDDAVLRLEFGRMVEVDRIRLYTRSDFPHDNWWKKVTFQFSDGSHVEFAMEKSRRFQEIRFDSRKISWLEMKNMKKSEDPSPFPALSQIEVYGRECRQKEAEIKQKK